jgi:hypothetical protein
MSLALGRDVQQCVVSADHFLRMAVDLGHWDRALIYAVLLTNRHDLISGAHYFKVSADLGNASGINSYASCLANGRAWTKTLSQPLTIRKWQRISDI